MNKLILIALTVLIINNTITAQVAINTDGSAPNSTAILDIQSTDKGVLLPRLTTTQRTALTGMATGLLVYDTDMKSLVYYDGTSWISMRTELKDTDGDTRIYVEKTSDEDKIRFDVNGSTRMILEEENNLVRLGFPNNSDNIFIGSDAALNSNNSAGSIVIGNEAGQDNANSYSSIILGENSGKNIRAVGSVIIGFEAAGDAASSNSPIGSRNNIIGYRAGYSINGANHNDIMGHQAGYSLSTGFYNVLIGNESGKDLTDGRSNIAIGYRSGANMTTAKYNVSLGYNTALFNTIGDENTNVGYSAGRENIDGIRNVCIGSRAGYNNIGDSSVFIGQRAGYFETNGHRLYIDNTNTSTPLIYGEFENDLVRINGTLNINNEYSFPTTDGTNGQTLVNNGNGNLHWTSINDQNLSLSGTTLTISNGNSITLPTTTDNLGNHTATQNIVLNNKYLSNDGDNEGILIDNNGRVKIGHGAAAKGSLTVGGNISVDFTSYNSYGRLNDNGCGTSNTNNRNVSIWAEYAIVGDLLMAVSDERIKNVQSVTNNEADLETLMKIEITDYTYKDEIAKGKTPQKKVIAQQVATIYPQAVNNNNTDVVPDIMTSSTIINDWITLENHDLKVGEKVKILFKDGEELLEVLEIKPNEFQVKSSTVNRSPFTEISIFIYGREVNDFHIVDYDALSMLNVSATQALVKRNEKLKNKQAQLKAQLDNLEEQAAKINDLEAMILELKAAKEQ